MTTTLSLDMIGKTVTFRSKNSTDPTVWKGVFAGIVAYNEALKIWDVVNYNAQVQKTDPSVGSANTLQYFVIEIAQGNTTAINSYAFAPNWVVDGTFEVLQSATIYTIDVYDLPANGETQILSILKAAGYNAVPHTS